MTFTRTRSAWMDEAGDRWATPAELSKRTHISERTLRDWCAKNKVLFVRPGGYRTRWLIRVRDLMGDMALLRPVKKKRSRKGSPRKRPRNHR